MLDRVKAIENFSKIRVEVDSLGLIPAYGVMIQNLPSGFWNGFSRKILDAAGEDLFDAAEALLENAAAECGYHTGYGIMTSDEFEAVLGPQIKDSKQELLHGLYAVFSTWGWADAEIVELVPSEKMIVHAYDYYESDIDSTERHFAHMIKGISRAFMDLAYSEPYPNGLGRYSCVQTKGIEKGDDYGEFIVRPVNPID